MYFGRLDSRKFFAEEKRNPGATGTLSWILSALSILSARELMSS